MRILYAIQGTGNGHVSRAREIVPLLQQHGEVDLLISGTQVDVKLVQEIKYRFHGFSFIFGKKGGVDHYKTWKNMDLFQFRKDMKAIPLRDYNLILNDFEPISAWACKLQGIESVSLSHQASFKSKKVPRPKTIDWGKLILSRYAPTTHHIGFHFDRYDDFIYKPVIRSEIRQLQPSNLGHYTVYLPAIDDKDLVNVLKQIPQVRWEVFSKHAKIAYHDANVFVEPVNNEKFNASMASCAGVFTGGGFEGPAEALHLGKKLLVAPMRFQYEQQCNAYALKQFGLPVIWGSNRHWVPILQEFVANPQEHQFDFPDETAAIIAHAVNTFAR
ncbi:glycosyltransferase family protein [Pedobacter nanyangensis]|uniref:glycosyltransferase family protein n=1 Tax=Pedobacter nanyangensis TaxID=1562389 RepID=UPI000DE4E11E|nr:glycosyltransferase family protein [Pedobacter nanyangensis]